MNSAPREHEGHVEATSSTGLSPPLTLGEIANLVVAFHETALVGPSRETVEQRREAVASAIREVDAYTALAEVTMRSLAGFTPSALADLYRMGLDARTERLRQAQERLREAEAALARREAESEALREPV